MDSEKTPCNHRYFTRSKKNNYINETKPKKTRRVLNIDHHDEDNIDFGNYLECKQKPNLNIKNKKNVVKFVNDVNVIMNTDDSEKSSSEMEDEIVLDENAQNLLTNIIMEKALLKLLNVEDSDEEYKPLEGFPKDVIYTEEEEEYVNSLSVENKEKIIELETKMLDKNKNKIPDRFRILNTGLSISVKNNIINRLDHFYSLEETDNEYHKLSQWVYGLNKIPFDTYTESVVNITDKSEKIVTYLHDVKTNLDNAVFGHNTAKTTIIQEIARQITNPTSFGNCIAIQGPPGNGKTTLIKDGVCKAINRPFAFITLGGLQNSEFLIGHEYTYEGSKSGRIVEILQESGTMDPVIYFDELDKLSDSPKGEEIANLLCHLTDTSQNDSFHDKYYSGIDFDLSRASFIFSYNDESKVNPILLDRMIKIKTDGFNTKDKLNIAKQYLIPKVCSSIGFNIEEVIFNDYIIQKIITLYTNNEKGVRNLKRAIQTIIEKLNVLKLLNGYTLNTDTNTIDVEEYESKNINNNINNNIVSFSIKNFKLPIEITDTILNKLLTIDNSGNSPPLGMYA